jgi:hypothetical protein
MLLLAVFARPGASADGPETHRLIDCPCPTLGSVEEAGRWEITPAEAFPAQLPPQTRLVLAEHAQRDPADGGPEVVEVFATSSPLDSHFAARSFQFTVHVRADGDERWWRLAERRPSRNEPEAYDSPQGEAEMIRDSTRGLWLHLRLDYYAHGSSSSYSVRDHLIVEVGTLTPVISAKLRCGCGEQGGACLAFDAGFWGRDMLTCGWDEYVRELVCVDERTQPLPWADRRSTRAFRPIKGDPVSGFLSEWSTKDIATLESLRLSALREWIGLDEPAEGTSASLPLLGTATVVRALRSTASGATVRLVASPRTSETFEPHFFLAELSTLGQIRTIEVTELPIAELRSDGGVGAVVRNPEDDLRTLRFTPRGPEITFASGSDLQAPPGLHVFPLMIREGSATGVVLVAVDARGSRAVVTLMRLAVDEPTSWGCWIYSYPTSARILRNSADPFKVTLDLEPSQTGTIDEAGRAFLSTQAEPEPRKTIDLEWDAKIGLVITDVREGAVATTFRRPRITGPERIEFIEMPVCPRDSNELERCLALLTNQ